MSLFGAMRTGVSGMAAFSNRLSAVADNIGNSSTTGYKQASVEFETMLLGSNLVQSFSSGSVGSHLRYDIGAQGALQQTTRVTDLAILGSGFFVVSDNNGAPYLTRAGAFVPDASGYLVNTAGYRLMGYDLSAGAASNGTGGLVPINLNQNALIANPSTEGRFAANLPSDATITPSGKLPSTNAADAAYAAKSSLTAYDNLGNKIVLDVYFAKTGDNTWEMSVYDQAGAASGGGFPYSAGALSATTLGFDPATGKMSGTGSLSVAVPNGRTLSLDLGNMTQLATKYTVVDAQMNGNAPSLLDHVEIGDDGTVSAVYQNGARLDTHRIPLAEVASPGNLTSKDGNVFAESPGSGSMTVGSAREGGLGRIVSGALENSTVDLASELTTMIEAQRGYSANSKVFQTGAEMLDVLLSLKP